MLEPEKRNCKNITPEDGSKLELGTFVNPTLDWGFKRILSDKDILIDFLNAHLPTSQRVKEAQLIDKEHLATSPDERTAIFDIHAEGVDGKKFIVEVQRALQINFTKRCQYYVAREISEQGEQGETRKGKKWEYELPAVSLIAILNFVPKPSWPGSSWIEESRYHYRFEALEVTNHQRLDDLWSVSLVVLPSFKLEYEKCVTRTDKWAYLFKNLVALKEQEVALFCQDPIFGRVITRLRVTNLSREERAMVTAEMERARIHYAELSGAREEGWQLGQESGRLETEVSTYEKLVRHNFKDNEICELMDWSPEKLATVKRAVTPPNITLSDASSD